MPLGARVEKWLQQVLDVSSQQRLKAAESISNTSEFYFHERRITPEDRYAVIRQICPLVADESTEIRACVAQLIGLIREWCSEVEVALRQLLCDTQPTVLVPAVGAAGHIGPSAAPVVNELLSLATHPDRDVRYRISWALSTIKVGDARVTATLIQLASDEDRVARMYAFDAMGACKVDPAAVFAAIARGLDDEDGAVQSGACRAVAELQHDWSTLEVRLFELFRQCHIDAVIAICKTWPEKIQHPEINAWLQKNRGFWWAQNFLDYGVMHGMHE